MRASSDPAAPPAPLIAAVLKALRRELQELLPCSICGAHGRTLARRLVDSCRVGGYFDCVNGSPDRRHLAACYQRQGSIAGVAAELGVAYETARRWLRDAGIALRPRGRPSPGAGKAPVDQLVERYRNGESVATIAATMDVSPNTVRNRLIDAGEQLRPRPGWKR